MGILGHIVRGSIDYHHGRTKIDNIFAETPQKLVSSLPGNATAHVAGMRGEKAGTALDPELSYGIAEKYHAGTVDGSRRKLVVRFLVESEINPVGLTAPYFAIGRQHSCAKRRRCQKCIYQFFHMSLVKPNHLTT